MLDAAVARFELDRLLYDIEVEAQHDWLRRMMAFDAFCARRDRDARRRRRWRDRHTSCAIIRALRGVAQPGSAHRSGR